MRDPRLRTARISDMAASFSEPVFLAGMDNGKTPRVTLHVRGERAARAVRGELKRAPAIRKSGMAWRVRSLSESKLAEAPSLEAFAASLQHDEYVYDPTLVCGRIRALVAGVSAARQEVGALISGVYFGPKTRSLHAVLNAPAVAQRGGDLPGAADAVYAALQRHVGACLDPRAAFPICVSWHVPAEPLVPVDTASCSSRSNGVARELRPTATWTLATGLAALLSLGFSSDGYAADPAVSRLNGKVAYDVGAFDGDGGSLGEASVSVPVADKLGLQIDAAGGKISADDYWGVGGHVFTRDPEKGLVGLIASYQALEGLHLERGGAEGELYWKGFLFRATAGYQGGNTRRGMFEGLGVKYYITENFMLESYTESAASVWLERFGFEYAPGIRALPGLSVFAEGAVGEGHYDRWLAGLRYYFGPEKSLQKRHAEDDPDSLLPDGLNLLEQKRSAKKVRVSSGSGGEGSGGEGSGGEGSGGEGSGGEGSTSPSR